MIIFMFAMIIAIFWFRINYPKIKGRFGEKHVINTLQQLDSNEFTIFNDFYIIKEDGKTSQIDHIVVSKKKGIIVIETKNYNGWILGKENQANWTQINFKRKDKFYNPIWQNYGHIQSLEKYLGEVSEKVTFHSLIVFGNQGELKFKETFKKAIVINRRNLLKSINNIESVPDLLDSDIQKINLLLAKLQNTNKKDKKSLEKQHVKVIKNELLVKKEKIKHDVCPRCKNKLVVRKSNRGEFKGCSNFPKCRFTA